MFDFVWGRTLVSRLSGSVVTREARESVWDVCVSEGERGCQNHRFMKEHVQGS